jgi:glycerol-3-phosphate dehydrogenase
VLPLKYGSKKNSILIPKTKDGRVLFIIPWQNHLLVGTTDNKYPHPDNQPTVSADNIQYLFEELSHYVNEIDVHDM